MEYRFPNTLTFRLTLWYATAFAAFLFMAFCFSYLLIKTDLDNEISDDLIEDIEQYKMLLKKNGINLVIEEINRDIKATDISDEFIQLIDTNGRLVYSSDISQWKAMNLDLERIKGVINSSPNNVPILETLKFTGRDHNVRIAYSLIGPGTIILVGESLEHTEEILELLLKIFLVMFCIIIPLASVVGWLVAKKAVSGIEEVSHAVMAIKNGNLEHRVSIKNQRTEIQNLADTFNSMADRIRQLINEMREMIDNIAHDLRSPLGRIRVISEMTLSGSNNHTDYKTAAADTLEQCDRLLQYINSTLDVAEAEAGVGIAHQERINISALTRDACELFEPVAEEKNIEMSINIEPDCWLTGNKQNLQRMIANILDNALKYTISSGLVKIILVRDNQYINITVTDTGIGIPFSDQHRVFDRFFRCDHSRSEEGCGLGLSFSRAVARAHGGDITLSSNPGINSTFIVKLPVESTVN